MENIENTNHPVPSSPSYPSPELASIWAKMQEQSRTNLEQGRAAANGLFDRLGEIKITRIEVTFDGCGDSGQIENISVEGVEESILDGAYDESPQSFMSKDPVTGKFGHGKGRSLRHAIEDCVYDLLEGEHGGWELNEGSYGSFVFDVAARQIHKEFNERIEEVRSSSDTYEF